MIQMLLPSRMRCLEMNERFPATLVHGCQFNLIPQTSWKRDNDRRIPSIQLWALAAHQTRSLAVQPAPPSDKQSDMAAPIYVTAAQDTSVGLLSLPDIFGPDSDRNKADADRLAAKGYAVVLVDLTNGDWVKDSSEHVMGDGFALLQRKDFATVLSPALDDGLAYLQTVLRVRKVASYGSYCFGSLIGAILSTREQLPILGHVSFHPSWAVEDTLHGPGSVEKLARAIRVPQLLLSVENHPPSVRGHGVVEKALLANDDSVARLTRVVDFPHVKNTVG